jgi:hypothetical protein
MFWKRAASVDPEIGMDVVALTDPRAELHADLAMSMIPTLHASLSPIAGPQLMGTIAALRSG